MCINSVFLRSHLCYFELLLSDVMFLTVCCKEVNAVTNVVVLNCSYMSLRVQCEMSAALSQEP